MDVRKYGTRGDDFLAKVNCFRILRLPTQQYVHYDVSTLPEIKNPGRAKQILYKMQQENPQYFNPRAVYDGQKNLFVALAQSTALGSVRELPVHLTTANVQREPNNQWPRGTYRIKLVRTAEVPIHPAVYPALLTEGGNPPQAEHAMTLLQLLIRAGTSVQSMQQLAAQNRINANARSFFTDHGKMDVNFLELWHGFTQSARRTIGRMVINVDVTVAAMYLRGNLIDVALQVLPECGNNPRHLDILDRDTRALKKLKQELKGVRVTVKTIKNNRQRTIRDLQLEAGEYEFDLERQGQVSRVTVREYYHHFHGRVLRFPALFGIKVGNPQREEIIPAELCDVVAGQFYRKKLPPNVTSDAIKFAKKTPAERLRRIEGINSDSPVQRYGASDYLINAGVSVETQAMSVRGRVLPAPPLLYQQPVMVTARNGAWNVNRDELKLLQPGRELQAWGILNFNPRLTNNLKDQFRDALGTCCVKLGMFLAAPALERRIDVPGGEIESILDEAYLEIGDKHQMPPQLLVIMLPDAALDLRRTIKRWGDGFAGTGSRGGLRGVATQCIRGLKFGSGPRLNQYCNNIALKINVRLGGVNWIVRSPSMNKLKESAYMIVGVDVSHGGPGSTQASVASLVFSYDGNATQYRAISRVQAPRQEKVQEMGPMMLRALQLFWDKHSPKWPRNLIIFRDGLSEKEYETVAQQEIADIEEAIRRFWATAGIPKEEHIKMTFMVVGKRHHVRYFPVKPVPNHFNENCPAGFVDDRNLANPSFPDFYLLSHGGLLGTSRPAHYIIIRDEAFEGDIDLLQDLAYALCHIYAKATRSVSIPAPVYYADLVCTRASSFYFSDDLVFGDGMTVGSGSEPFDLQKWQKGFMQPTGPMQGTMYFI